MRQVEINESALSAEGEDNTFVNPSLLLSQQVSSNTGISSASIAGPAPWQKAVPTGTNIRSGMDAFKDSEADLMSIFQRKRSVPSKENLAASGDAPGTASAGGDDSLMGAFSRSRERSALPITSQPQRSTPAEAEVIDLEDEEEEDFSPLTITYSGGGGGGGTSASERSTAVTASGVVPEFGTSTILSRPGSMGPPSKPMSAPVPAPASVPSFGLASSTKAAAFHVPEKVVRTKDSTIADYFAKPSQPTQSTQFSQSSQGPPLSQQSQSASQARNSQRPTLDIPKFRTGGSGSAGSVSAANVRVKEEPKSFLSYVYELDDEQQSVKDPVTEFHHQIGKRPMLTKLVQIELLSLSNRIV